MNEQFSIGEIAIFWDPGFPTHNTEVVITSILKDELEIFQPDHYTGKLIANGVPAYELIHACGRIGFAGPKNLRKKKPPEEDASWKAIEKLTKWNPTKIEVVA